MVISPDPESDSPPRRVGADACTICAFSALIEISCNSRPCKSLALPLLFLRFAQRHEINNNVNTIVPLVTKIVVNWEGECESCCVSIVGKKVGSLLGSAEGNEVEGELDGIRDGNSLGVSLGMKEFVGICVG